MMAVDVELLQIFRDETNERLDRIVTTLLAIESAEAEEDALGSLFRDAHSIKGNAGMVGFDEAQQIAHAMEDVLEQARLSGALAPTLAAPLLDATDVVRKVIEGQTGLADGALDALHGAVATVGEQPLVPPRRAENGASPQPNGASSPPHGPADRRNSSPNGGPEEDVRSMRVGAAKVDRLLDVVGETVLHRRRLDHLVGDQVRQVDEGVDDELGAGDRLLDDLRDAVISMRMLPLSSIAGRFPRAVRDLALAEGKEVRLEMVGTDTQLDRLILDGISENIVHLLRNAISHGIETSQERARAGKPATARVELRAEPRGDLVAVSVADDGGGVPAELLRRGKAQGSLAEVLAEAGLSTAEEVTELAGRGVGLGAVKRHVESLGGSLVASSRPGHTEMTMLLPLTTSLLNVLLLERGGCMFGLPLANVSEVVNATNVLSLGGKRSVDLRGTSVTLVDLADVLGAVAPPANAIPLALVVSASGRQVAVICDRVIREEEAVVKTLGPMLHGVPGYLGATVLPDGRIALILDPSFVCAQPTRERVSMTPPDEYPRGRRVLVVDDEFTVRELQRSILEAAGYEVITARDGREALETLTSPIGVELVVSDIEMPEMNGLELLGAIRGREHGHSLPVIVVTSHGSEEDRQRGADAGADAYIVKGDFEREGLLAAASRLLVAQDDARG